MKTGTKSLLFGVHQFAWHPLTVWLAWVWLYRRIPTVKETICIIIHDWGYWASEKMDDERGERHPELGAKIAMRLFGSEHHHLCLFHSRHYARNAGKEPSLLCWADKMSIVFEPWWLYLPRAWASGELDEYRQIADEAGFITRESSGREWHRWIRLRLSMLGRERRGDAVPYVNPGRQKKGRIGSKREFW